MDYKKIREYAINIVSSLNDLNDNDYFDVLGEILIESGLRFLGNLVKKQYEPPITNQWLKEECCYAEGNKEAGHISLGTVLGFVEDILNTATTDEENHISFKNYTVRLETNDEMEEYGHDDNINWYIEDEKIDKEKLIAFEIK